MRLLKGLLAALLWILAAVVGLLGVVLSLTLILLPLGLPLLGLARRMFGLSMQLVLPRTVTHPVDELDKATRRAGRRGRSATPSPDLDTDKVMKRSRKRLKRTKAAVS